MEHPQLRPDFQQCPLAGRQVPADFARLATAVLTANQEAKDGLATFLLAQEQTQRLAESVKAAALAYRIVVAQYRAGTVDFNRVDTIEQNLVQQQNLETQARSQIATGLIQVYRALGGGWGFACRPAGPPRRSRPVRAGEVRTARWFRTRHATDGWFLPELARNPTTIFLLLTPAILHAGRSEPLESRL